MKIIHLLLGKPDPNSMNGVNKVVHNLATSQKHLGYDVEVWGITATPNIIRHKHEYPLRLFKGSSFRFMVSKDLIQAIGTLKPDTLMHFHSVFIPEFIAVRRLLIQKGIPWVLTPHGGYAPRSLMKNRFAKIVYLYLFEKHLVDGAKTIHAIGETEVSDINRLFNTQKIILVPNGQNPADLVFKPKNIDRKARPVFGFCGRLATDHKGLDLLIKGFSKYHATGGKGVLWLIGDGQDKNSLKRLCADLGVENDVIFWGKKSGQEKLNLLSHMDVFIHTSCFEGLPMAVLEAAGLSLPLLVSKETNMGTYVKRWQCGTVLTENTPHEIAKALKMLTNFFNKGKLSGMGEKAQTMILAEFQWPKIAGTLVQKAYK